MIDRRFYKTGTSWLFKLRASSSRTYVAFQPYAIPKRAVNIKKVKEVKAKYTKVTRIGKVQGYSYILLK